MTRVRVEEWTTEEKLEYLKGMAIDGATDKEIAEEIGINVSTLYKWKKKSIEFRNALKGGKKQADDAVKRALYKRAIGYKVEETRVEIMPDGTKKGFQVTKEIPPDVTACIYWLKNRDPEHWRDRPIVAMCNEFADDGLIAALKEGTAAIKDDSDFLPNEEK